MTQHPSAPALYPSGDRSNCPLPAVGKYWAWRFGTWLRVEVTNLPERGGTGTIIYAPRNRKGYPWHHSAALQDSQAFWGPVKTWGTVAPRVSRQKLVELGLERYLPKRKGKPRKDLVPCAGPTPTIDKLNVAPLAKERQTGGQACRQPSW